jgi:hypothetical protein
MRDWSDFGSLGLELGHFGRRSRLIWIFSGKSWHADISNLIVQVGMGWLCRNEHGFEGFDSILQHSKFKVSMMCRDQIWIRDEI